MMQLQLLLTQQLLAFAVTHIFKRCGIYFNGYRDGQKLDIPEPPFRRAGSEQSGRGKKVI